MLWCFLSKIVPEIFMDVCYWLNKCCFVDGNLNWWLAEIADFFL